MSDISGSSEAFDTLLSHLPYLEKASKDPVSGWEIKYLLGNVEFRNFSTRELLYHQDRPVEYVYLMVSGRVEEVRTLRGEGRQQRHRLMRTSEAGRLLGIHDVLYRQPHSTWARAVEECRTIAVSAEQINRLLYRFPNLRSEMAPLKRIARLRAIPLLEEADLTAISYLADCVDEKSLAANERLYDMGALAETIYLIDHGQMELDWGGGRRIWLGNGGELGVEEYVGATSGSPYSLSHSATAVCPTTLLSVPRRQFTFITEINPEVAAKRLRNERLEAVNTLHVFSAWPEEARQRVLGAMSHYHIHANHLLTQQDEIADSLWVLLPRRRALLHATDRDNRALPETRAEGLTYFNETALRYQASAASTLEAEAGSQWLRLHYQDFRAFLKQIGQPELEAKLLVGEASKIERNAPIQSIFPWLQRGERIVIHGRRHWLVLLAKLALPALLSFFVLLGAALIYFGGYRATWLITSVVTFGALTILAYVWAIEDYRNDYLVVTNLRVARQEKLIFFYEMRQIAPLEQVQNVGIQISFWGKIFGYADVNIQTASTTGIIRFDRMAGYATVAKTLEAERLRRRQSFTATGKKQIYALMENRLGVMMELPSRVWPREGASGGTGSEDGGAKPPSPGWQQQLEQDTGATIVWRKHWIVLFRNLSIPVIILISSLTSLLLLWFFRVAGPFSDVLTAFPTLLALILAGVIFWIVEDWRNDRYILEQDQVIDIEAKPLGFDEKRKVALLSNIVDINMSMPSPIHYIFNFGYVYLQTAATEGRFTFDAIPNPHGVVEIVRQRIDAVRRRSEEAAARQRAQELPEWFEIYNRLGQQNSNSRN